MAVRLRPTPAATLGSRLSSRSAGQVQERRSRGRYVMAMELSPLTVVLMLGGGVPLTVISIRHMGFGTLLDKHVRDELKKPIDPIDKGLLLFSAASFVAFLGTLLSDA